MNPEKENAAWGSGAERTGNGKETRASTLHSAENLSKRFSTLQARLALRGYEVLPGKSGDCVVTRNGLSRYCQDIETLEHFCLMAGA